MPSNEIKFQTLYDHYKETCSFVKDANKTRDLFFFYIWVLLAFILMQVSCPMESLQIINALIEKNLNLKIAFKDIIISNLLLFAFLSILIRYYQITIYIERLYPYIHKIEEKISSIASDNEFITREGKSYLSSYPHFSKWIHKFYTWIFPILLNLVIFSKLLLCFNAISLFLFVLILITTILYLFFRGTQNK